MQAMGAEALVVFDGEDVKVLDFEIFRSESLHPLTTVRKSPLLFLRVWICKHEIGGSYSASWLTCLTEALLSCTGLLRVISANISTKCQIQSLITDLLAPHSAMSSPAHETKVRRAIASSTFNHMDLSNLL